jgi:ComF family protein
MKWTAAGLTRPGGVRVAASQCEVCRRFGSARLCADCLARHAPSRWRCTRCALPVPAGQAACGECLRDPPAWDRAISALDYGFPWDHLIAQFKFHARTDLAGPLAQGLAAAVLEAQASPVDIVAPVPLGSRRLAERGFNQAWEIARRLAPQLGLRGDPTLLIRPVETAHQADLPRAERERNLRGAFIVHPERHGDVRGRVVAVVDDVLTTGATAREATLALRRAGAAAVQVWTVARTA